MRILVTEEMDAGRLNRRRFIFFSSILVLTSVATWFVADLYWRDADGLTGLEIILLVLFVPLFAHISVGFCTAFAGFYVINRGGDSSRISLSAPAGAPPRLASTAIVMPVFNEDVSRVFEGIRVVIKSVQKTAGADYFDFFILSDSNQPNQWIREEVAWAELCKQVGGFGKIFYRKRRQAINKKAGNVADFLRRWGKNYRYMVVLDADSIMTGEALVRLVSIMEANPSTGIIQTAPRVIRGETLYARLYTYFNGVQVYADFTYTAAQQATLISPAAGPLLQGPVILFTWTKGNGATNYAILVGTTGPGSSNLINSGQSKVRFAMIGRLPAKGETIYARLSTNFDGVEAYTDYIFEAR